MSVMLLTHLIIFTFLLRPRAADVEQRLLVAVLLFPNNLTSASYPQSTNAASTPTFLFVQFGQQLSIFKHEMKHGLVNFNWDECCKSCQL